MFFPYPEKNEFLIADLLFAISDIKTFHQHFADEMKSKYDAMRDSILDATGFYIDYQKFFKSDKSFSLEKFISFLESKKTATKREILRKFRIKDDFCMSLLRSLEKQGTIRLERPRKNQVIVIYKGE